MDGSRSGGPIELAAEIADAVRTGLWLVDAGGRTLYRNATFEETVGALDEAHEFFDRLPGVPLDAYFERVRSGDGPVEEPAVLMRRAQGEGGPGELVELRLERGPVDNSVLVCVNGVSHRTRVQRLAALAETLVALGHEISNPLAILHGEIDVMARQADESAKRRLERMRRSAGRIDAVLERMRRLSEPKSIEYLRARGVRMMNLGDDATESSEEAA